MTFFLSVLEPTSASESEPDLALVLLFEVIAGLGDELAGVIASTSASAYSPTLESASVVTFAPVFESVGVSTLALAIGSFFKSAFVLESISTADLISAALPVVAPALPSTFESAAASALALAKLAAIGDVAAFAAFLASALVAALALASAFKLA